ELEDTLGECTKQRLQVTRPILVVRLLRLRHGGVATSVKDLRRCGKASGIEVAQAMRLGRTRLSGGTTIDADLLRVPVGPGSLHVERYGHGGQAVLLVHGFGTCSFVWRNIAPAIAQASLTAFAVDLFGHGESDRPFDADYGIAAQAEYLDRALTARSEEHT